MPSDVVIHIDGDSQRGRAIKLIADHQLITPEQALDKLIDAGIRAHYSRPSLQAERNGKRPESTDDLENASLENKTAGDHEHAVSERSANGALRRRRYAPVETDDPESVIGMFKDTPGFREAIDAVIARRYNRNGGQS